MNIKKLAAIGIVWSLGVYGSGVAHADPHKSDLNEFGSLLVFPLVTNIGLGLDPDLTENVLLSDTIIDIANTGDKHVNVECHTILHGVPLVTIPPGSPHIFEKRSFIFTLSPHQKVHWKLSQGNRFDLLLEEPSIPAATGKGFMYCFAVGEDLNEIKWDKLKGDATILGPLGVVTGGGTYNAIPHQAIEITPDRVLNLDGKEYTKGFSEIWVEGLTRGTFPIGEIDLPPGFFVTGAVAMGCIDANFNASTQCEFDANYTCWNRRQQSRGRHRHVSTFDQHRLLTDLDLTFNGTFGTRDFLCRVRAGEQDTGKPVPVYAVFLQFVADPLIGLTATNVFVNSKAAAPTRIVLD